MVEVHSTAVIGTSVQLGEGTTVGPYAVIEDGVRIGKNCKISSHAVIRGCVELGDSVEVFSFAVLGGEPQHLKYKGEPTRVEIGDRSVIREYVTVNRGTEIGGGVTRIGKDTFIMAYTHVAHDCQVGASVILANAIQLAGHVIVGDNTVIGGQSGIAQFCRVGDGCYIGGGSIVRKDLPPFLTGKGNEFEVQGINSVGLLRRGVSAENVRRLKEVFKTFYLQNLTVAQAVETLASQSLPPEAAHFVDFVRSSKVGITR